VSPFSGEASSARSPLSFLLAANFEKTNRLEFNPLEFYLSPGFSGIFSIHAGIAAPMCRPE